MCHYWPVQVKRDSNQSSNMYKVFNSTKAKDFTSSQALQREQKKLTSTTLHKLLDMLVRKIEEKYYRVAEAFKFFASPSQSNKVTFNDFVIGLENLRLKLETKDIMKMFEYLDKDRDGHISYQEFCGLAEERRMGLDPFENEHKDSIAREGSMTGIKAGGFMSYS